MSWDSAAAMTVLADLSVRVLVILVLSAFTVRLMRSRPARLRHVVWATAMVGVLLVPGLAVLVPDWHVNLLPSAAKVATATLVDGVPNEPAPVIEVTLANEATTPASGVIQRAAVQPSLLQRLVAIDWRVTLLALWLTGAVALMLSLARGLWRARALRTRAMPLDHSGWPSLLADCSERLGIRRVTDLAESDDISAPMTWGFVRPVILLPAASREWSDERRRVVLLHELAHIQRNDWVVHVLSRIACIVYWFNPLVWLGANHMNIEREKACDDDVIAAGTKPSAYAAHLLDIARSITSHSNIPVATLTMARITQLEGRLVSILNNKNGRRGHRGWLPALLLTPVIVALASLQPWSQAPDANAIAEQESDRASHHQTSTDHSYRFTHDETDMEFESRIDEVDMRVRIEGHVRFDEEGTRIIEMDRDAVVRIEAEEGRTDYELEITHNGDDFEYDWRVDGRRADFDDDARAWMNAALPIVHDHLKLAMLWGEHHSLQGEIHSIFGERHSLQGQIHSIHGERNSLHGEINSVLGERSSLLGEINSIHGHSHSLQGEINSLLGERNSLESEINAIYGERNSVRGRYRALESEKRDLRRQQRKLERRIRHEDDEASDHDKETHELLEQKISEIDQAQAELEKDLDDGLYDSRVREIQDRLEAMRIEDRVRELELRVDDEAIAREVARVQAQIDDLATEEYVEAIRERIGAMNVDERVEAVQKEIEALMVDDKVLAYEERIKALNADKLAEDIDRQLDQKYEAFKRQMRSMTR